MMRKSIGLSLALALAIGAAAATSQPNASADEPKNCSSYKYTDDGDPGGSSGDVTLDTASGSDNLYAVQFSAKGEYLDLFDFTTDGHKAEATVAVTNPDGFFEDVVDFDRFTTGTTGHYNLGSPDGSGNIPDGYHVWIRLRHTGGSWCYARMFTA